jgi:hypothetical protein
MNYMQLCLNCFYLPRGPRVITINLFQTSPYWGYHPNVSSDCGIVLDEVQATGIRSTKNWNNKNT